MRCELLLSLVYQTQFLTFPKNKKNFKTWYGSKSCYFRCLVCAVCLTPSLISNDGLFSLCLQDYIYIFISQNPTSTSPWSAGGNSRILNEWCLSYVWLNQYFIRFSISYVKNVLKVLLKLVSKISFAKLGMHILIPTRKL
jgi:hypothetical protein